MTYTKPVVIAQNSATGSFAAGCPLKERRITTCDRCELTK